MAGASNMTRAVASAALALTLAVGAGVPAVAYADEQPSDIQTEEFGPDNEESVSAAQSGTSSAAAPASSTASTASRTASGTTARTGDVTASVLPVCAVAAVLVGGGIALRNRSKKQ